MVIIAGVVAYIYWPRNPNPSNEPSKVQLALNVERRQVTSVVLSNGSVTPWVMHNDSSGYPSIGSGRENIVWGYYVVARVYRNGAFFNKYVWDVPFNKSNTAEDINYVIPNLFYLNGTVTVQLALMAEVGYGVNNLALESCLLNGSLSSAQSRQIYNGTNFDASWSVKTDIMVIFSCFSSYVMKTIYRYVL